MPHIKRRGGQRGNGIKPNTTRSQPKLKKKIIIFVSLTIAVSYVPNLRKKKLR